MVEEPVIVGYIEYVARSGDSFDQLALFAYDDELQAHRIINANPNYADVLIFSGGEALRIPKLFNLVTTDSLPPWRR